MQPPSEYMALVPSGPAVRQIRLRLVEELEGKRSVRHGRVCAKGGGKQSRLRHLFVHRPRWLDCRGDTRQDGHWVVHARSSALSSRYVHGTTPSSRPSTASSSMNPLNSASASLLNSPRISRSSGSSQQDAEKPVFAQAAQKSPDARRHAGYPSAGWVQVRGVLSPYVAAPPERANAADGPFFGSLLGLCRFRR
jgi:hypothetical protein